MWRKRQNQEFQNPIFLLGVFDVYLINFTNNVACELKNNQHLALKSDPATQGMHNA